MCPQRALIIQEKEEKREKREQGEEDDEEAQQGAGEGKKKMETRTKMKESRRGNG